MAGRIPLPFLPTHLQADTEYRNLVVSVRRAEQQLLSLEDELESHFQLRNGDRNHTADSIMSLINNNIRVVRQNIDILLGLLEARCRYLMEAEARRVMEDMNRMFDSFRREM